MFRLGPPASLTPQRLAYITLVDLAIAPLQTHEADRFVAGGPAEAVGTGFCSGPWSRSDRRGAV